MGEIKKDDDTEDAKKDETPAELSLDAEADEQDTTKGDKPKFTLFEASENVQVALGGIILVALVAFFIHNQNFTFPEINFFPEMSGVVKENISRFTHKDDDKKSSSSSHMDKDNSLYSYEYAGVEFYSPYEFELTDVKYDNEQNKTFAHYKAKDSAVYVTIAEFHRPSRSEIKKIKSASEENLKDAFDDADAFSSIALSERIGSINYIAGPTDFPIGKYYSYLIADTSKRTKVEVYVHTLSKEALGDKIYYGLLSSIAYNGVHLK